MHILNLAFVIGYAQDTLKSATLPFKWVTENIYAQQKPLLKLEGCAESLLLSKVDH